jgi:hypothetical protein
MESDLPLMNMGYSAKLHGKDLYYWLEDNDFPSGFQILCWNCNFAKGSLGKCPHEKTRLEETFTMMDEQSSFEL